MKRADILTRGIGVTFKEGTAYAKVWAPEAKQMHWLIEGEEAMAMQAEDFGYWTASSNALKPGGEYRFQKDDNQPLPDPASLSQPDGVHGASAAIDTAAFKWSDVSWNNVSLHDYIIYEMHVGTFTPEGTFAAIAAKLDYLKELGITAIEIMPVAQFPGSRNWGYDGVFPFAAQDSYGGAAGLQHLIDACHQKGLAVILDVVYNHMGPEGNYLGAYGPYFTNKYGTPWGEAINFDDAWCDGVRQFFIENVLMWFRDFHIDALRMDAVHAIKDLSPLHILQEMRQHVDELMEATGRKHYMIVECDLNDTRFINTQQDGGFGMDAQWMDEFHHALRVAAGQERSGYYADFSGISHLAKSYQDAYVYDGQYSEHRHKYFGVKTENKGEQFIIFSQNHDQVGNRMLGERSGELYSIGMQKLLAGATLLSPFTPMLFMGEEWGETAPFQYFVSHTDPQLVEAVRKGRKAEFAAFQALGEAPDPQSEETFNRSKLQWNLPQEERHSNMLQWYKDLIALRKKHPVLTQGTRKELNVLVDDNRNILMLHRWHEDHHLIALMNFSAEPQSMLIPPGDYSWKKILDSEGSAADSVSFNIEVQLAPESIVIYSNL